jgi:hypothetical protein
MRFLNGLCHVVRSRNGILSVSAAGILGAVLAVPAPLPAQEKKAADKELNKRIEDSVEKGLEWLKKTQAQDGHWEAPSGAYKTAMTGLAGMCFLMEGSNLKEGKYSDQVKKAVEWCLAVGRQQPNGLIADNRGGGGNFGNYMHGHGYITMFLACAYGEEEDKDQREKLEKCIKKAIEFICKAQTNRKHRKAEGKEMDIGGWGYTSSTDNNNFDEGSVTITQLQAMRAARNAGIPVPKDNIDRATNYLEACTTPKGGIIYSYANSGGVAQNGQERPPLTAAAISCSFSAGQYKSELAKKWIKYCKESIPIAKGRVAHEEYQSYYFAQTMYVLGEDRYGDLFPKDDKSTWLTWSKYREVLFPYIIDQQSKTEGNWTGSGGYGIGPVYVTAVNLTILQLEKGVLPIYQR